MGLFDYKDYRVVISPDSAAIPPFKKIWERDKTQEKHKASQELSYIYFMYDFKSPYNIYPEEDRKTKVMTDFIKNPDWTPDKEVLDGIEAYKEFQRTYSMRFLESARGLADKLSKYFDDVDFSATDEAGKLLYSAKDAVANLKQVGDVIESLDKVEEKVKKEIDSKAKIRGKKIIRERER